MKYATSFQKLGFSQIIAFIMAGLVLISGLAISLLGYSNLDAQLNRGLHHELQQQLERLALNLVPSINRQDRVSLTMDLQEWLKSTVDIQAIRIYDTSRNLLAQAGRDTKQGLVIDRAITQDNFALGSLQANASLERAAQTADQYLALGLVLTVISALLAGLVGYVLAASLLGYVQQLPRAIELWQQDPSKSLKLPQPPKLLQLQPLNHSISQLAIKFQQQQNIEQAIARFGAHSLKQQDQALKYHSCAMLFIEVANLDELQQELSVEQLTLHLNRYYQVLLHACKLYQGRLERYAGNGVVVLFGIENDRPAVAALHALYTAQLFLSFIGAQHDTPIRFSLAAHWGQVLLAPVTNPSQANKNELVSDALHWAAHLASQSQVGSVLVSEKLHEQLDAETCLQWQGAGTITDLYGNQQASWVLLSLGDKQQKLIERQLNQLAHLF